MVRPRRHLVLLLLGLVLGWPLSGSAPSVAGASTHVAVEMAPDGCVGCDGGSAADHQTCPSTVCPVVPAIVPALALDWLGTRAMTRAVAADERGRGWSPDPQTLPPRTAFLA